MSDGANLNPTAGDDGGGDVQGPSGLTLMSRNVAKETNACTCVLTS